ncbi:MAG TPA: hypothetical protein VHD56_16015 [Tepidisphaeraceae bacterium]|nr:hypothetical protein [Tepidisphaeraceae bacterium]
MFLIRLTSDQASGIIHSFPATVRRDSRNYIDENTKVLLQHDGQGWIATGPNEAEESFMNAIADAVDSLEDYEP